MKFKYYSILSIICFLTLLSGCAVYPKRYVPRHYKQPTENDIHKLTYRATLNPGKIIPSFFISSAFTSVFFSSDSKWLIGVKIIRIGFWSARIEVKLYVWNVDKVLQDNAVDPLYSFEDKRFVKFSPDNTYFAVSGPPGVQLIRFEDGEIFTEIPWHIDIGFLFHYNRIGYGSQLEISPDGNKIALNRPLWGSLKIYDHTGKFITNLVNENGKDIGAVENVAFSPGHQPIFVTQDCFATMLGFGIPYCRAKAWNTETGKHISSMDTANAPPSGHLSVASNLAISPDGSVLITQGYDEESKGDILKLWSLPSGKLLAKHFLPNEIAFPRHLLFVDNTQFLVLQFPFSIIHYRYEIDTETPEIDSSDPSSPKLKIIKLGSIKLPYSCTPVVTRDHAGNRIPGINLQTSPKKLFLTDNGKLAVVCAKAGVVVFDIDTGELLWNFVPFDSFPLQRRKFIDPTSDLPEPAIIYDIALSPDLKRLAIATTEGIFLMDIPGSKETSIKEVSNDSEKLKMLETMRSLGILSQQEFEN